MGLLRVIKFGSKVAIAGGAIYYSNEFRIWGNHEETEKGCAKLKSTVKVSVGSKYREWIQ